MAMIGKKPTPMAEVSPELLAAGSQPLASGQMPATPEMPQIKAHHQGINWLGVLGDGLMGLAGKSGVYGPMMAQKQAEQTAFERGEQQYRTHRQDNNDDWMQHQIYQDAHKADAMTENVNTYMNFTPAQRGAYDAMHPKYITGPNGETILVGGGGSSSVPTAPIGRLTPMGGPGSQAPGTFRR